MAATSGDSKERTKNIPKNPHPLGPLIHPFDLNQEKYVKLQEELETLRNALSHSSFANTSKFFARCMSITVTPMSTYKSGWILNSGATDHMTVDISCLENFSSIIVKKGVITAGGHILPVLGVGCVRFENIDILSGLLYVPNLTANLISHHRLGLDLRCRILFDDDICFFIDKISGKETGRFEAREGLYQVDLPGISGQQGITSFFTTSSTSETVNKLFLKHCQLGHPSMKIIRVMFPDFCKTLNVSSLVCEACQLAKQRQISFPFRGIRSEIPLYWIHSDIWGLLHLKVYVGLVGSSSSLMIARD